MAGTPIVVRLIDTHCHLNDTQAFPVPAYAVEEARAAGVERLIVVGIDTKSSRLAIDLAEQFESVYAVVGWHPNHAAEYQSSEVTAIRDMLTHPKVVALGEIGLDFYRDHSSRDAQFRCLMDQLDLAAETQAKVVFHCRDAYPDLLDVLEKRSPHPYLFHCFAGNQVDADRAMALDCYFGVDGPITYKSADALRQTVSTLPLNRIVIETDSPWMSPAPNRGQRNKPAWVAHVCAGLADTLGMTPLECAENTRDNALEFFGSMGL